MADHNDVAPVELGDDAGIITGEASDDVKYAEGTFKNEEEYTLFTQSWLPPTPRALVFLLHGLGEHSTRYANFARYLSSQGFGVYSWDHQSHGLSEGPEEYVDHFDDLLADSIAVLKPFTDAHSPNLSRFVIGFDMGATIATTLCLNHPALFDAAVLIAPRTNLPSNTSEAGFVLSKAASFLLPWIRPSGEDATTRCRDPVVVKAYQDDPVTWKDNPPMQFMTELNQAALDLLENADQFKTPVLVLQGEADKMASKSGTLEFFNNAGSVFKSMILFKGLYHELLNEPEKDLIFDIIEEWLEGRIDKRDDITTSQSKQLATFDQGIFHLTPLK